MANCSVWRRLLGALRYVRALIVGAVMKGITHGVVKRKFEIWARELDRPIMKWVGGKAQVGSVHLDLYHGYHVEMLTNETGGVKILNGWRMNRAEMCAWFEGCMYALEDERLGTDRK